MSNTTTLSYSEGGVNFTLSITGGDGANFTTIGGGSAILSRSTGTNSAAQDIFVLDVIGAGETRFDGNIVLNVATINGAWTVNGQSLVAGSNMLTGPQSNLVFTGSSAQSITIGSLVADINCFLEGTRIATPDGPRTVETLEKGDIVLTQDGEKPVTWLGRQIVDTRVNHPTKINPICIRAGALAEGVPERDLYLSPDHAIEWDGFLINAGALVNGTTITQVAQIPLDGFAYYHVETDAHDLLVAEGLPAESYLDVTNTHAFENWEERDTTTLIREMALPRISAARMLPASIKDRLSERASALLPKHAA